MCLSADLMTAEHGHPWRQWNARLPAPLRINSVHPIPSSSPGLSEEAFRIHRRVDGFDWMKSYAWVELAKRYGPKLVHEELVSIADLVANRLHIKLDRDARRRKIVMIKWFEENWTLIHPLLEEIVLDS
jgi:hypothetical protein